MLNRDFILSQLSPYTNNTYVLIQNQTVGDIKKELLQWHKKYQSEYDKIAPYFKGDSIEQSAQNVFDFLKLYVDYNIESENEQSLRSPAAIIAPGKTVGADCKNYALFTAGILDSISRNTDQHIPLSLRFASYDLFSSVPTHVFTDINCINKLADQIGVKRIGNAKIGVFGWDDAITMMPEVIKIFSQPDNSQAWVTTASKDDWGWWLAKDPSNNPANNFIAYFSKHPEFLTVGLANNPDTGIPNTIAQKQQIIKDRLTNAGYGTQINSLLNAWNGLYNISDGSPKSQRTGTPALPGSPATQAGMNIWITVGLAAAGIYFISKMKK